MQIVALKCPNCKGSLTDVDYINSFYCSYCGERLEIDGQSKTVVRAKLRVREMEHEERVIDKEYQFRTEERKDLIEKNKENNRSALRFFIVCIVAVLLMILITPTYLLLSQYLGDKKIEKIEMEIVDDIYKKKLEICLAFFCSGAYKAM